MKIKQTSTLLELMQTMSTSSFTDEEVVALVAYLVNSGRVRLCGTFAGAKIRRQTTYSSFLDTCQSPLAPSADS